MFGKRAGFSPVPATSPLPLCTRRRKAATLRSRSDGPSECPRTPCQRREVGRLPGPVARPSHEAVYIRGMNTARIARREIGSQRPGSDSNLGSFPVSPSASLASRDSCRTPCLLSSSGMSLSLERFTSTPHLPNPVRRGPERPLGYLLSTTKYPGLKQKWSDSAWRRSLDSPHTALSDAQAKAPKCSAC